MPKRVLLKMGLVEADLRPVADLLGLNCQIRGGALRRVNHSADGIQGRRKLGDRCY